ncbi:MAG: DUF748 domain-containing protein [Burkholderiales bacterium]|nr:DUF748 domain-containing protein [Burkholderiales bacterium]
MRQSKWTRRAGWAVAALFGIWLVAWLAVPPIARAQIEKLASEQLGRKVTVERIDFRPWSLEFAVEGLSVTSLDGSRVQLAVRRLYIDAELQSLLRWAPVIDAVRVEAPRLALHHLGNGRYDIDDIVARLAKADAAESAPPSDLRFALYNIALTEGSIDFLDDTVGRTHEVRSITLGVPFLSNLPSQRDVEVAPHLAFELNGSRFDTGAEATPFADKRRAEATLHLAGLDVSPYLGYMPDVLPVRLRAAVIDADLKLAFEQQPIALRLEGQVKVSRARLAEARAKSDSTDADWLSFDELDVQLADVRPLERTVKLASVRLDAPVVSARRDAQGRIDWLRLASMGGAPGHAAAPLPAAAASDPARAATPARAWQFELAEASIDGARLQWSDAAVRPAARIALEDLSLKAQAVAWPLRAPARLSGTGRLAGSELVFDAEGTDLSARANLRANGFALAHIKPYLDTALVPTLTGAATADIALEWEAPALAVNLRSLVLEGANLAQGRERLASVRRIEVADTRIDLAQRRVAGGRLTVTQPQLRIERDEGGEWLARRWLREGSSAGAGDPAAAASTEGKPWALALGEFAVDGGAVSFVDRARPDRPVALDVSALRVRARDVSPAATKAFPLQLSARLASAESNASPGRIDFDGSVTPAGQPGAQGQLVAESVPLHPFSSYLSEVLNIELLRAQAGFRGRVRFASQSAGPLVQVNGDVSIADLRANTARARAQAEAAPSAGAAAARAVPAASPLGVGQELLNWRALALRGLAVDMAPGKPTRVDVSETALADFYASISISETGRINLQDIVRQQDGQTPSQASPQPVAQGVPAPAGAASAPAAAASGDGKPPAVINFGPIVLSGGRVLFSDRFVRPNYSADLSELSGRLEAFSSVAVDGQPQMAALELRGRAEGTATLEITGRLNPLAQPLALDIQGKVRDLELPPLSPYSVKYAGHGIERGKLSVDVSYRVQPDGQLTASNRLILNQLSFGDPVQGAPASLPVRLAVALLADRNGVIDIDLPISGSLNDPQFSLGPVIFKVIVNLVVKAITSPFSLLAGLGAGADEMGAIEFVPGTAELKPDARDGLEKVARALTDRPALRLTVVGTAGLDAERSAWQRARLAQLVLAEKRRAAVVGGRDAASVTAVAADEYAPLLRAVYRRSDIEGKPRNLVGMQRDLPVPEMEALLLAHLPASEDAMRELAVQRAVVVRDYLASRSLPPERLFLGAPHLQGQPRSSTTSTGSAPPTSAWTPRAELTLATR